MARHTQKSAFNSTRKRKFPKINGQPSRKEYSCLCREVQEAATQEYVPYKGAEDNGYLAEVLGDEKYTALLELEYERPEEKPALVHPDSNVHQQKGQQRAQQTIVRKAGAKLRVR